MYVCNNALGVMRSLVKGAGVSRAVILKLYGTSESREGLEKCRFLGSIPRVFSTVKTE